MDEFDLEIENRIQNLAWTVSDDYSLKINADVNLYKESKVLALYNAIKQGASTKYFNRDDIALYVVKKVFLSGDEEWLIYLTQMCLDVAIREKLFKERSGTAQIRKKAYEEMLDKYFDKMSGTQMGRVKLALIQDDLGYNYHVPADIKDAFEKIKGLRDATSPMDVIEVADYIYNKYIDTSFEKRRGNLDVVLSVSIEEMAEFNWRDFLKEESYEDFLEQYIEEVNDSLVDINQTREEKKEKENQNKASLLKVYNKEKDEKIYNYVELNYGKSFMNANDARRLERKICRGAHAKCKLYYTEGVTRNPVMENYQYKYVQRHISNNIMSFHKKHRLVKRNVTILADTLKRSVVFRNQKEEIFSDAGVIVPERLWKIGRTSNAMVFKKELKSDNSEFVVEILMDASGSQSKKQDSVAIQGYIISAALSEAGIPHSVVGFCSFWNYTILHRYRDFDDDKSYDRRVLEYVASANNRDGLALRAAAYDLEQREEDNKILIVLSDGKPNDNTVSREGVMTAKPYIGSSAVKDTAMEVRRIRNNGISVLGVFTGNEEDLAAEKKIYGKDFAYIRKIDNFSNIVSTYLKKQITEI